MLLLLLYGLVWSWVTLIFQSKLHVFLLLWFMNGKWNGSFSFHTEVTSGGHNEVLQTIRKIRNRFHLIHLLQRWGLLTLTDTATCTRLGRWSHAAWSSRGPRGFHHPGQECRFSWDKWRLVPSRAEHVIVGRKRFTVIFLVQTQVYSERNVWSVHDLLTWVLI